jgi:transposase
MIPKVVYNAEQYDIYIGNDVDKKSYVLNIRERYRQLMTKTIPAEPEQLYNFIRRQFPDQRVVIGYEAGPTGYGLHDYMTERDTSCVLVPTTSIRKPANDLVKTNRLDARKLSNMLAEGDFHPVRVPEGPYRELRNLVYVRENYGQLQRASKQRIKSLLLANSLYTSCRDVDDHWSNIFLKRLKSIECTPAVRFRLDMLLEDLNYARQKLFKAVRELRLFCRDTADIKDHIHNLCTIPGIGIVTASTVLARIGDPKYLQNLSELGSFFGLVTREKSTGNKVRRGSITHAGDGIVRCLLVEASWRAIKNDKELAQFYGRIAGRHHVLYAKQKAIVAVARKMTLRIYRVLVERREYIVR